ncbi:hypothetical protein JKP88DRAFT_307457 [Tribonema minus]|uniref:Uncharacterized protein n=1 Tax=Tribonema minus TaxID=303371 RepID=A0A835ZBN0_9STRA|nr:hypothetical protein JKP88DRAFT_307457 [Tribonema minus]
MHEQQVLDGFALRAMNVQRAEALQHTCTPAAVESALLEALEQAKSPPTTIISPQAHDTDSVSVAKALLDQPAGEPGSTIADPESWPSIERKGTKFASPDRPPARLSDILFTEADRCMDRAAATFAPTTPRTKASSLRLATPTAPFSDSTAARLDSSSATAAAVGAAPHPPRGWEDTGGGVLFPALDRATTPTPAAKRRKAAVAPASTGPAAAVAVRKENSSDNTVLAQASPKLRREPQYTAARLSSF